MDAVRNPVGPTSIPILNTPSLPLLTMDMLPLENTALPEMEKFTVELKKDLHGLGITIAGYVCEKGKSGKKGRRKIFFFKAKNKNITDWILPRPEINLVSCFGNDPGFSLKTKIITKNWISLSGF